MDQVPPEATPRTGRWPLSPGQEVPAAFGDCDWAHRWPIQLARVVLVSLMGTAGLQKLWAGWLAAYVFWVPWRRGGE